MSQEPTINRAAMPLSPAQVNLQTQANPQIRANPQIQALTILILHMILQQVAE
jgi:hypothetical protein